jgi:hypothetical protein
MESTERAAVRINVQTGEVEIHGTEQFVERLLPVAQSFVSAAPGAGTKRADPAILSASASTGPSGTISFRDFLASKGLDRNTPSERAVTAIVYYLTKIKGAESATTEQILQHFELAGIPKPLNPNSTLNNVRTRRGFLTSAGRGEVRLTIQGENFVAHELGAD